MKKVAINPRNYYNTPSRNYVAGEFLVVGDDEAETMEADGVATIVEDVEDQDETQVQEQEEEI